MVRIDMPLSIRDLIQRRYFTGSEARATGRVGRPDRQQSSGQTSWLGPISPSAGRTVSSLIRSTIRSRNIATYLGCVPAVPARTMGSCSFCADFFGFDIQIEQHFHVIGNEPDGHNHHLVRQILLFDMAQVIADVRFQPRLIRRPAAALVHQDPFIDTDGFADQSAGFLQLRFVFGAGCHGDGDAVRREDQLCAGASGSGN